MKSPIDIKLTSLYAGVVCCVLLLVWVIFFDGNDLSEFSAQRETGHSTQGEMGLKNQQSSIRQSLSYKPRKKRIDVKARLAALYEKYPDLKPDYPESEKDFSALFNRLFPENEWDSLSEEVGEIEAMLMGESPWNDEYARSFVNAHKGRLEELLKSINSEHHYKELQFHGGSRVIRLLAVSYGLELRKGNVRESAVFRNGLRELTNTSAQTSYIALTLGVAGQRRIADYAFLHSSASLHEMEQILKTEISVKSFFSATKSEYTNVLYMVYRMAEEGDGGEFFLDNGKGIDPISVDLIEKIGAEVSLSNLRFYQELEQKGEYQTDLELESDFGRFLKEKSYNATELLIADIFNTGNGYYLMALKENSLYHPAQLSALRIGVAEATGVTNEQNLPINFKTGQSIQWDKERNVLVTGLSGRNAEIKIPVLKSE